MKMSELLGQCSYLADSGYSQDKVWSEFLDQFSQKVRSEFAKVKTKKVTKRVVSILEVLKDPSEHAEVRR